MKIHILYEMQDGAWGGGNQFQKALRGYLQERDAYAEEIEKTDAIFTNSHHWGKNLWEVFKLKRYNPKLVIIHRVDGPISVVRAQSQSMMVDMAIIRFNDFFADGTIFQSKWSKRQCFSIGMNHQKPNVVVLNAPDPEIFYTATRSQKQNYKIRLMASSWSGNWRKGFDIYQYLDENLDFSRYEVTFVGNSPVTFKNIVQKAPLPSQELADELRRHDFYITGSIDDPCSNSLIEAMHCGLIPIARNSGGHPEIIRKTGVLYEGVKDVISKIEHAVRRQDVMRSTLCPPTLNEVGAAYMEFAKRISEQQENTFTKPSWSDLASVWTGLHKIRLQSRWERLVNFARRV